VPGSGRTTEVKMLMDSLWWVPAANLVQAFPVS